MKRDIGPELLESIEAIKSGKGKRVTVNVPTDVKAIRNKIGLGRSACLVDVRQVVNTALAKAEKAAPQGLQTL